MCSPDIATANMAQCMHTATVFAAQSGVTTLGQFQVAVLHNYVGISAFWENFGAQIP